MMKMRLNNEFKGFNRCELNFSEQTGGKTKMDNLNNRQIKPIEFFSEETE